MDSALSVFSDPIVLKGNHVILEPLNTSHIDGLEHAAKDGNLASLWYTYIPRPGEFQKEIERRLQLQKLRRLLPFAVRRMDTGELCGMTNFWNIDAPNRRVEIGATWYASSAQRSPINTECKLLLLSHAFENLQCIAVELRTHWMNHRSREAILRLGAKQDGVLRNHQIAPDGSLRDTVVFSIIASEWPAVKSHLQFKLEA